MALEVSWTFFWIIFN